MNTSAVSDHKGPPVWNIPSCINFVHFCGTEGTAKSSNVRYVTKIMLDIYIYIYAHILIYIYGNLLVIGKAPGNLN